MDAMSQETRSRVEAVCRKWRVRQLSLFGSVLRNQAGSESDIDLLVDFAAGATPSLLRFVAAQRELSVALGRRADLVLRDALTESADDTRTAAILGSAKVLYAA